MQAEPQRLRILFVSARYIPSVGGTETHMRQVASRLRGMNHDVTILTTDATRTLPALDRIDDVPVRRARAWPRNRDYFFAPEIYRAIVDGQWDVVHVQGYHTLVAPMAMLACLRAGVPYVVSFHSGGHSSRLRTSARGLQWRALRPLLARAERLVAVSRFEAQMFSKELRLPPGRFVTIFNGSNLPDLPPPLPEPAPGPLILSVGRLERYKGHHRAIAAMPKVRQAFPGARLRIVGAGPYEAELRRNVESLGLSACVEIEGVPSEDRAEMARLMLQSSLVVLLSDYEAYPIAVLEALSLRRKALVTDVSGLSEFTEFPLVRAIPGSSTDDEVAAAMIEQIQAPASNISVPLPTWDGCAAALASVYQDVAGRA